MRKWSPNLQNQLKLSGEFFFQREWSSEQNFQKRMEFGALVTDDSHIQNYQYFSAAFLRAAERSRPSVCFVRQYGLQCKKFVHFVKLFFIIFSDVSSSCY
jgi:hypothetical protein